MKRSTHANDLCDDIRPHQGHMPKRFTTIDANGSGISFYSYDDMIITGSGVLECLPRTFEEREEFLQNMRVD